MNRGLDDFNPIFFATAQVDKRRLRSPTRFCTLLWGGRDSRRAATFRSVSDHGSAGASPSHPFSTGEDVSGSRFHRRQPAAGFLLSSYYFLTKISSAFICANPRMNHPGSDGEKDQSRRSVCSGLPDMNKRRGEIRGMFPDRGGDVRGLPPAHLGNLLLGKGKGSL